MPTICPKCQYIRKESDSTPDYECPACGIIYHKFLNTLSQQPPLAHKNTSNSQKTLYSEAWKPETRQGIILVIVVFTLMSLFFMRDIYFSLQVENWPKTTGVINYSYVSSGGRGGDKLNISYNYSVDGKIYQNDRANFGLLSLDGKFSNAQDAVNHYSAGKVVDVYYQESTPTNSVLEKKPNLKDNFLRILMLFSVVCVLSYYRFFKYQH
ncbi:MAG: DUF3592 domain-containing protein [Methylococcaceae bacterium]|nr:DUF3592 domain-containing protein [Methylococcaceae bacterium]